MTRPWTHLRSEETAYVDQQVDEDPRRIAKATSVVLDASPRKIARGTWSGLKAAGRAVRGLGRGAIVGAVADVRHEKVTRIESEAA